jgi:UBX domain-containing protein 1/4
VNVLFFPTFSERALEVTNNKGVEPAMEWLIAHADEEIIVTPAPSSVIATPTDNNATPPEDSATSSATPDNPADDALAKSIKCDECNRLFKSQIEVEFHAAKSGHSSFSESTEEKKPLTEEEKKQQLALIEEKLKQKRIEREENEKLEALEREKVRIKSGKDMTEVRRRMEDQEMLKILEQRKREKLEEKIARDRVKAKIEEDKLNRRARADKAAGIAAPPIVEPVLNFSVATSPSSKEYVTTRIQIRMQDGSSIVEQFNVKEQLAAVRLFIQLKLGDVPFGLMTNFPKKVFTAEDFETPLEKLGLVPTAVLIVTKSASN